MSVRFAPFLKPFEVPDFGSLICCGVSLSCRLRKVVNYVGLLADAPLGVCVPSQDAAILWSCLSAELRAGKSTSMVGNVGISPNDYFFESSFSIRRSCVEASSRNEASTAWTGLFAISVFQFLRNNSIRACCIS